MGKELNLNYSPTNAKEQSIPTSNNTHKHFLESWQNTIHYCQQNNDCITNTLIQCLSLAYRCNVLSHLQYMQPHCQARSASALVSWLLWPPTRLFLCSKKRFIHLQLSQGREQFVFIPCVYMCDVQSMCAVGDREMCECVSEWRKERSDEATRRGVGPRTARQRMR